MPISWPAIADYLAPIALGGAGAFATFVALLPSKLGERLVGHYFDKRIADLKHEQSVELGKLQADLDHLKDRGVRSNEREYQATSQAWERFVEAFRATKAAVIQFLQFPDLDRMPEEDLTSFLDANSVPEESKARIIRASDKKNAYSLYVRVKLLDDAGAAVDLTRDTLLKQSVFIPADLSALFDAALHMLHGAWVERSMAGRAGVRADQEASMALVKQGDVILATLRDAVRARLLRTS